MIHQNIQGIRPRKRWNSQHVHVYKLITHLKGRPSCWLIISQLVTTNPYEVSNTPPFLRILANDRSFSFFDPWYDSTLMPGALKKWQNKTCKSTKILKWNSLPSFIKPIPFPKLLFPVPDDRYWHYDQHGVDFLHVKQPRQERYHLNRLTQPTNTRGQWSYLPILPLY